MLASNKKRYGVSFFGSFLFHSFSLSFSVPPPPTLRLEYRNVLYTHAYTADWPKAHHEQSVDM